MATSHPATEPDGVVVRHGKPYHGYPERLIAASGRPLWVVIDATAPAAFWRLWGMTLVERNMRIAERFDAAQIHVITPTDRAADVGKRSFPGTSRPCVLSPSELSDVLRGAPGPLLLLLGHGVYDRRLIKDLWQARAPAILSDCDRCLAAIVDPAVLKRDGTPIRQILSELFRDADVDRIRVSEYDGYISLLRKSVPPVLIAVESESGLQCADKALKEQAGKGVNDLLAEFIHPPIEFFLTRILVGTAVTPNAVSWFNAMLNLLALPLIAAGWLWAGVACNLIRGVADGVDGKLARLTLRESQGGDRIDHVVDRLYLPAFFAVLGYHLSSGDPQSDAARLAGLTIGLHAANSMLAVAFRRMVGASSGEHRAADRLVRRLWPKRNICVALLLLSLLAGRPATGLAAMAVANVLLLVYRVVRMTQERLWSRRTRQGCHTASSQSSNP